MRFDPDEWRFCPRCGSGLTDAHIGELPRRVCPDAACGFIAWGNPVPVVCALIECVDRDGHMLLARNAAWPEGKFALVTGFLERDEAPDVAVAREVKEETGLDTQAVHWIGNYNFADANQVLLVYHVQATGEIALNEELAEVKLIPKDKLKGWERGTGYAVMEWLATRSIEGD
ncbi:NUDIX domain-containing protein [Denitromonas iodatirespirans]|uniref:NUDIX domain-containing protein n=1 Tax=Denitromonas iodatirespirans TaxID=2795389 RepID=A0A944H9L6_DENI1|nr:NUDIX domain-containing protein [Denitromonas iodatirespirans]MBT0962560.1 NUDIX domain-containing protein [Denitromonas iodatirespirans]